MIQLIAYRDAENGGTRLGPLASIRSFTATCPFNEVGSLTFVYPRQGLNADYLVDPTGAAVKYFEIGLEVDLAGTGTYTEIPNGRYVLTGRQDEGSEIAGDYTFTMAGYAHGLNFAAVGGLDVLNSDGKREFSAASAGQIMKTLLDENKALGWHPQLTYTFTSAVDSAGNAWGSSIPKIEYEPTMDLFTVLNNLALQGVCDWVMVGRELKLYRPDTNLMNDRSATAILHYGADLLDGPNQIQTTNLRHRALVRGEGGARLIVDQISGVARPWGVWTATVDQGGISDPSLMQAWAASALAGGTLPTAQLTRSMPLPATRPGCVPFVNFAPGDYIAAPGAGGVREKLRVREIDVKADSGVYSAVLTLNDRIQEQEIRVSRRVKGVVGGTTSGGGSGASAGYTDTRTPKTPANTAVTSAAYIDNGGVPKGLVTFTWDAVTQATDNSSIEVSEYEIWTRRAPDDQFSRATTQATQITLSPYTPGESWAFRVRAKAANGRYSLMSAPASLVIASDATAPDQPSTPTVVSNFGTLRVTWDGKTISNVGQPADYVDTTLHVSQTSGFTPSASTATDTFTGPGSKYLGGVPYGQTRYFKLVSRDRSGNQSVASTQVACTQEEFLSDIEIGGETIRPGTIDYTRMRMGQGNLIVDPTFTDPDLNTYRASPNPAKITVTQPNVTYPTGAITVVDLTTVYFGVTSGDISSDRPMEVKPGAKYAVQLSVERLAGTGSHALAVSWLNSAGAQQSTTLVTGIATQDVNVVWTAPADAVRALFWFRNTVNGITSRIRNPLFAEQVSGTLIQDGSISTPKIISGAIIADKMAANSVVASALAANSVTAGKIAAGAVTATTIAATAIDGKTITGSILRTAATGARVEFNTTGLKMIDGSGATRVDINTSGSAYFIGVVRTNMPGLYPKVEMTNSGTYTGRPGIRLSGTSAADRDAELAVSLSNVAGTNWLANSVFLSAGEVSGSTRGEVRLTPNGGWTVGQFAGADTLAENYINCGGTSNNRVEIGAYGQVWVHSRGDQLFYTAAPGSSATNSLVLGANGKTTVSTNDFWVEGRSSGALNFRVAGGTIDLWNWTRYMSFPSLTSGGNILISGNVLGVQSSLSRLKLHQEPIGVNYGVLEMAPKTWEDLFDTEQRIIDDNPDPSPRVAGFVAEDLRTLSGELGGSLDPLLYHNDAGELVGIHYDRIVSYLLPVVRDMNERLTALEAQ